MSNRIINVSRCKYCRTTSEWDKDGRCKHCGGDLKDITQVLPVLSKVENRVEIDHSSIHFKQVRKAILSNIESQGYRWYSSTLGGYQIYIQGRFFWNKKDVCLVKIIDYTSLRLPNEVIFNITEDSKYLDVVKKIAKSLAETDLPIRVKIKLS